MAWALLALFTVTPVQTFFWLSVHEILFLCKALYFTILRQSNGLELIAAYTQLDKELLLFEVVTCSSKTLDLLISCRY